jgi:hypothetical protein
MGLAGHVGHMGEMRNAHKILVRKHGGDLDLHDWLQKWILGKKKGCEEVD